VLQQLAAYGCTATAISEPESGQAFVAFQDGEQLIISQTGSFHCRIFSSDGRLISHGSGENRVSCMLPAHFTGIVMIQVNTGSGTQSTGLFIH
jgi:hypothetical protein